MSKKMEIGHRDTVFAKNPRSGLLEEVSPQQAARWAEIEKAASLSHGAADNHVEGGLSPEDMVGPPSPPTRTAQYRAQLLKMARSDLRLEGYRVQELRARGYRTPALVGHGPTGPEVVCFGEPFLRLRSIGRSLIRALSMPQLPRIARLYIPSCYEDEAGVKLDAHLQAGRIRSEVRRVGGIQVPRQVAPEPFEHELRVRIYSEGHEDDEDEVASGPSDTAAVDVEDQDELGDGGTREGD